MARYLTVRQVEEVPHSETISDFDELGDEQQQAVHDLVDGKYGGGQVDESLDGQVV